MNILNSLLKRISIFFWGKKFKIYKLINLEDKDLDNFECKIKKVKINKINLK